MKTRKKRQLHHPSHSDRDSGGAHRRTLRHCSRLAALVLLFPTLLLGQPTGQWDFDQGNLSATIGSPMEYSDGEGGSTSQQTQFGTTTSFGIPDIQGAPAKVMKFPAATTPMGYRLPTPLTPNGDGSQVNEWTILFDLYYPPESHGKWRALIDTDLGVLNSDSELFINTGNGIGISGNYQGVVTTNQWHRLGFTLSASSGLIKKYIDGMEVGSQSGVTLDGRWALSAGFYADLFTDNDGETAVGYVNSIQLRDTVLTSGEMLALGGPSANGIPAVIPTKPAFIASRSPAHEAVNVAARPQIQIVLDQGDASIQASSIQLLLDGETVSPIITPQGNQFQISFTPTNLFSPSSVHGLALVYQVGTSTPITNAWSFTVGNYKNIRLPAPLYLETFNTITEGELPAGWSVTNWTDVQIPGLDLESYQSDSYADFVVISRERLLRVLNDRRLGVAPVVVNGQVIETLIEGNFIYAESDLKSGSQVQVLFTSDYDFSGKTNIYVSYYSTYEQNQDNIAAVEYSVDGGKSWLPIIYMLDGPDIIKDSNGRIDAVATLETARGDHAHGLAYGAFIGAPISTNLAPFINERINDDPIESKRVELFRLPQADNQPSVRLRFMQAGTASWYFGIDNLGFYSIDLPFAPTLTTQPLAQIVSAGASTTFKVDATGTPPLSFQWQFNGANIPNATQSNYTVVNAQAAQAGEYSVVVSNEAGTVSSEKARLTVFSGAITQDLVVHLKFDNDLADSSGRTNDAQMVGAPTFREGKIGPGALHIPSGGDYATLGTPPDLNFGTDTDFSISFWARATEWSGDPSFLSNKDWNSGGNQGYVIATDDDGHLQWNLSGAPGGRKDYDGPPGTFSDHQWRHVVITFDRNGLASTMVDGNLVDTRPLSASLNDVSTPNGYATNIGQDGTGNYGSAFLDADMDDLGIWRRLLTPQEIRRIYQAGLTGRDLTQAGGGDEAITLRLTRNQGSINLVWEGGGVLQRALAVAGPWEDVPAATNPFRLDATSGQAFFRLIQR